MLAEAHPPPRPAVTPDTLVAWNARDAEHIAADQVQNHRIQQVFNKLDAVFDSSDAVVASANRKLDELAARLVGDPDARRVLIALRADLSEIAKHNGRGHCFVGDGRAIESEDEERAAKRKQENAIKQQKVADARRLRDEALGTRRPRAWRPGPEGA